MKNPGLPLRGGGSGLRLAAIILSVLTGVSAQARPWSQWGRIWASAFANWGTTSRTPVPGPGVFTLQLASPPRFTLADGPTIEPLATNAPLLLDPGPNQETVLPESVDCTEAGQCVVTATLTQPHPAGFGVRSGSNGLQEALNFLAGRQGTVILDAHWPGSTSQIASAQGTSDVQILDQRPAHFARYSWNGTAYVLAWTVPGGTDAVGLRNLEQIRFADNFAGVGPGPRIDAAAAEASNAGGGAVWVPSSLGPGTPANAACSFTGGGECNVNYWDWRTGSPAQPEINRLFDFPQMLSRVWDASPNSSSPYALGNPNFLPVWRQDTTTVSPGSGEPINLYLNLSNRSFGADHTLNTGSSPTSAFINNDISFGGRAAGVWGQNATVAVDAGWPVVAIARIGGSVTLQSGTLTWGGATYHVGGAYGGTSPIRVGDQIMVAGVSGSSFNGGPFTVTAVGADSITYAQDGPDASSSGGAATLDAQMFGYEINMFNSIGDSGSPFPQSTRAKWGFALTQSGTFPIMASYLSTFSTASSPSSPAGNRPHVGYTVEDAIDDGFHCGDISASAPVPGGPLVMTACLRAGSRALATAAANSQSLPLMAEASYWNGNGASTAQATQFVATGTGANPNYWWEWDLGGVRELSMDATGVLQTGAISATSNGQPSTFSAVVNQCSGVTAAMAGGVVTVRNPCLTGARPIILVEAAKGGVQGFLSYTQSLGVLVISSSSSSDTSTVSWVQN